MINLISNCTYPKMNSVSCKKPSFGGSNLAPLKADTVSFSGVEKLPLEALKSKDFTPSLYIGLGKLKDNMAFMTGEELMYNLTETVGELIAKRMKFLEISDRIKCGAFSVGMSENSPKFFKLHDVVTKKNGGKNCERKFEVDWTSQYNVLKKILDTPEKLTSEAKVNLTKALEEFNLLPSKK